MAFREYDDYPAYVSAAERRARAARQLAALEKAGRAPKPVVIEGRDIARTFWGKAWCDHLESLADLANRLPRGRTYVRNGSVLDLKIARGEVRGVVSGTEAYDVGIGLDTLPPERWRAVREKVAGRIASIVELLSGRLSASVMAVLCDPEHGLFPRSRELDLSCSCPDGARLCKHLAAVLYAIGARLDESPELLFTLRGVDLEELVAAGAAAAGAGMGGARGGAEIPEDQLAEIFGIALEVAPLGDFAAVAPASPTRPKRRPAKRADVEGRARDAGKKRGRRSKSHPRRRAGKKASR